jgi:CDP-diglyceride synthetase
MSAIDLSVLDLIGALLGFLLTVFIFSYIVGDNVLFRIATHLFIGVAAGYVAIVVIQNIILPQMIWPFFSDNRNEKIFAILFLILGALMLTKISPRLNKLGNPAIAYLVGVGAAAAIGGAVVGTIFPQTSASINVFVENDIFDAFWILVGTLTTLLYFHFGIRRKNSEDDLPQRPAWLDMIGNVGQFFIAVTFGALFSGVYLAAIMALIERASYIWNLIQSMFLA